jgi:hypothetical protein
LDFSYEIWGFPAKYPLNKSNEGWILPDVACLSLSKSLSSANLSAPVEAKMDSDLEALEI